MGSGFWTKCQWRRNRAESAWLATILLDNRLETKYPHDAFLLATCIEHGLRNVFEKFDACQCWAFKIFMYYVEGSSASILIINNTPVNNS